MSCCAVGTCEHPDCDMCQRVTPWIREQQRAHDEARQRRLEELAQHKREIALRRKKAL